MVLSFSMWTAMTERRVGIVNEMDDYDRTNSEEVNFSTMFMDHVLENDTKQDTISVLSVLDAMMSRIKKEHQDMKYICRMSDNATCYQNDTLPVDSYFEVKHTA